jgi:hypothetical protein
MSSAVVIIPDCVVYAEVPLSCDGMRSSNAPNPILSFFSFLSLFPCYIQTSLFVPLHLITSVGDAWKRKKK